MIFQQQEKNAIFLLRFSRRVKANARGEREKERLAISTCFLRATHAPRVRLALSSAFCSYVILRQRYPWLL